MDKSIPKVSLSSKIGDKELSVNVEKISNGYIVCQNLNYYDKKQERYVYKSKKTYYKENPLDGAAMAAEFETTDFSDFTEY